MFLIACTFEGSVALNQRPKYFREWAGFCGRMVKFIASRPIEHSWECLTQASWAVPQCRGMAGGTWSTVGFSRRVGSWGELEWKIEEGIVSTEEDKA